MWKDSSCSGITVKILCKQSTRSGTFKQWCALASRELSLLQQIMIGWPCKENGLQSLCWYKILSLQGRKRSRSVHNKNKLLSICGTGSNHHHYNIVFLLKVQHENIAWASPNFRGYYLIFNIYLCVHSIPIYSILYVWRPLPKIRLLSLIR